MAQQLLSKIVRFCRFVILGPIWLVPMRTWRGWLGSRAPQAIKLLSLTPGVWGIGTLLLGTVKRWPLAVIGDVAQDPVRAYSPVHFAFDQLAQLSLLTQISAPLEQVAAYAWAWCLVAVLTTVFLSPLYLLLLRRENKKS